MPWIGWVGAGFGLLSLIVVALYWVGRRRIERKVPHLGLFFGPTESSARARSLRLLRHPLSLLLQLLLLLLFALALALRDPQKLAGRPEVWLIETGISMSEQAQSPGLPSRPEILRKRLHQRIDALAEGTVVSMMAVGATSELLVTASDDKAKLRSAANELVVQDADGSFGEGFRLARNLGYPGAADVIVFGDELAFKSARSEAGSEPTQLELVPRQPASMGLSVESFAARRYPLGAGQFEVSLRVHSEATVPVGVRATLLAVTLPEGREQPIEVVEFEAKPAADTTYTFARRSGASQAISCRIERVDGASEPISVDNVARAMLPSSQRMRVLIVGDESLFLTAALLAAADVELEHVAVRSYPPQEARPFDLTIFRDFAPPFEASSGALLYLGSTGPGQVVQFGKPQKMFGIDESDRRHSLFRLFDPYDTQILSGFALVPGSEDRTLAKTSGLPLVVEGVRDGHKFLSLGFAPENSDMVLRPAFPLFIRGALEELVQNETSEWLAPGRVGELVHFQPKPESKGPFSWHGPLGAPRTRTGPLASRLAWTFAHAGFYALHDQSGVAQYIAVNPRRARVPLASGDSIKPSSVTLAQAPVEHRGWIWMVLVLSVTLLVEYYLFHRRWVV